MPVNSRAHICRGTLHPSIPTTLLLTDTSSSFLVTPSTYARLYRTAPLSVSTRMVDRGISVSTFITTLRGVDGSACSMQTRTTTPLISMSPMTMSGLPMGIRVSWLSCKEPLAFTEGVDSHYLSLLYNLYVYMLYLADATHTHTLSLSLFQTHSFIHSFPPPRISDTDTQPQTLTTNLFASVP